MDMCIVYEIATESPKLNQFHGLTTNGKKRQATILTIKTYAGASLLMNPRKHMSCVWFTQAQIRLQILAMKYV